MILLSYPVTGQTLSVESFKLLDNDLTANTRGTMKYDQNGDVAALIKVVTTENDFNFDVGSMGIVATSQQKGEIWVYVPGGVQRITISHSLLGVLRNYYFPVPVEKARTYELVLTSGRINTIVQDVVTAQWVTFTVQPQNAIVTIDNNPYALLSDGTISRFLNYGTHSYRIDAPGYISENGIIEVGREPIMREVNLKSSKGTVTLECSMKEAEIYLNGELVGTGSWTGDLESALYQVEVKRESHRTRTTSFVVQPQDEKNITLPVPQPIYGTISVTSAPIGATVYIDGVEVGTTPFLKGEILVGKRKVEFRKQDYRPVTMDVEIKEGELTLFSTELSDVFMLSVKSQPVGAVLSIDGKSKGATPYKAEFSSGDYSVELTKSGYAPYKKKIHLDASHPELSITLQRKILSKTNFYAGSSYQSGHVSGTNVFAGTYIGGFNIEGGYLAPYKAECKVWYIVNPSTWDGYPGYEMDCYLSNVISVHAGYGIMYNNRLRLTPRVGLLINNCNSYSDSDLNEQTFVVSGHGGLRLEYSPFPHFGILCTPAFDIPFKKGDIASQLETSSPVIKDWYGGFSFNFGVELYF